MDKRTFDRSPRYLSGIFVRSVYWDVYYKHVRIIANHLVTHHYRYIYDWSLYIILCKCVLAFIGIEKYQWNVNEWWYKGKKKERILGTVEVKQWKKKYVYVYT